MMPLWPFRSLLTTGGVSPDRLNVSSKGRGYVPVEFSSEESPLVKEAMEVKTWDDVVNVCKKLYDFIEDQKDEKEE